MGRCAGTGGCPEERSETAPRWLVEPSGAACGRLEDTCKAKRLIANDGVELRSAHLSCFAYRDPLAGVDLIRTALSRAAERGFPALLVAVDASDADELRRSWTESEIVIAPATVYGSGLKPGSQWNINTAEI